MFSNLFRAKRRTDTKEEEENTLCIFLPPQWNGVKGDTPTKFCINSTLNQVVNKMNSFSILNHARQKTENLPCINQIRKGSLHKIPVLFLAQQQHKVVWSQEHCVLGMY